MEGYIGQNSGYQIIGKIWRNWGSWGNCQKTYTKVYFVVLTFPWSYSYVRLFVINQLVNYIFVYLIFHCVHTIDINFYCSF